MRSLVLIALVGVVVALPAQADRLLIERLEASAGTADTPRRGSSMERVRERFGEPEDTREAVGDPPITRWEYDGFTVFFEHDHVIHAVRR